LFLEFQQATILLEDLPGFIFESNRGTKHSFIAETSLGPEFAAGWGGKKSKKTKADAMKTKVGVDVHFNFTHKEILLTCFALCR
jgi:hypothetical protein